MVKSQHMPYRRDREQIGKQKKISIGTVSALISFLTPFSFPRKFCAFSLLITFPSMFPYYSTQRRRKSKSQKRKLPLITKHQKNDTAMNNLLLLGYFS